MTLRFTLLLGLALTRSASASIIVAGTNLSGTLQFSTASQNSTVTDQAGASDSLAFAFTALGTEATNYSGIGFTVAAELTGGSTAIFSIYDDGNQAGKPTNLLATTQLFGLSQTSFQRDSGSFTNLVLQGGHVYYLEISLPFGTPGSQWVSLAGTSPGRLGFSFTHDYATYPPELWTQSFGDMPAFQITAQSAQTAPEPSTGAALMAAGLIAGVARAAKGRRGAPRRSRS